MRNGVDTGDACSRLSSRMTPRTGAILSVETERLKSGVLSAASFSTAISDDGTVSEATPLRPQMPFATSSASTDGSLRSGCSSVTMRKRLSSPWTLDDDLSPELQASDPRSTNLDYFGNFASMEPRHLMGCFTKVKQIAMCCRGDGHVELHHWQRPGRQTEQVVVVKRVLNTRVLANRGKEVCEHAIHYGPRKRDAEDTRNEIGIYSLLSQRVDVPQYILRMQAVFQDGPDTWLVLEHADGGDLFSVVKSNPGGIPGNEVKLWTWQLLQAISYLHRLGIGHRDISIENILLLAGTVKLMDFGQAVQTRNAAGEPLRYFHAIGKPYYLAPECYVPNERKVEVDVSAGHTGGEVIFDKTVRGEWCHLRLPPNAAAGSRCLADVWGYAVESADIFACGVCHFITATGMPPWRKANCNDAHFQWIQQHGVSALLKSWQANMPSEEVQLLESMLAWNPAHRPDARGCLAHTFYDGMQTVCDAPQQASAAEACTCNDAFAHEHGMLGDFYQEPGVVRSSRAPLLEAEIQTRGFIVEGDPYQEIPCTRSYDPEATLLPAADLVACATTPQLGLNTKFDNELLGELSEHERDDAPPSPLPLLRQTWPRVQQRRVETEETRTNEVVAVGSALAPALVRSPSSPSVSSSSSAGSPINAVRHKRRHRSDCTNDDSAAAPLCTCPSPPGKSKDHERSRFCRSVTFPRPMRLRSLPARVRSSKAAKDS
mmetsp:Transcript_56149/g.103896  ORF Transcript_56149/g.103896 Transcript_56149/m.103896 type:complete len:715 (-) Transcript_56149:11-2155(-)